MQKKSLSISMWHPSHIGVDMKMTEREIQDMLNAYLGLTYQRKQEADIFKGSIEI